MKWSEIEKLNKAHKEKTGKERFVLVKRIDGFYDIYDTQTDKKKDK